MGLEGYRREQRARQAVSGWTDHMVRSTWLVSKLKHLATMNWLPLRLGKFVQSMAI